MSQTEHRDSDGPILGAVRAYAHGPGKEQWDHDVGRFSVVTRSRDKLESIARAQVCVSVK